MADYNQRQLNNGQQGSGSGLDADTVDTKESSDLGNTIDNSSITENEQGQIQVAKPFDFVAGSWENGNFGGWTTDGDGGILILDRENQPIVQKTNAVEMDLQNTKNASDPKIFYRTLDLTGLETLEIHLWFKTNASGPSELDTANIAVNEDVKVSKSDFLSFPQEEWLIVELDVSQYGENAEISFNFFEYNYATRLYIGFVGYRKPTRTIDDNSGGWIV